MTLIRYVALTISLTIVMSPALALCDTSSHAEKLKKLAALDNVSETITDYRNVCLEKSKDYDPEKMVVSQPDMFAGVRPGSIHWPKVVTAFRKYVSTSCEFITEKEYLAEYIRVNTPLLTEKTLDSILHFYETPEGKAYLKATNTSRLTLQTYLVKKQFDKTKAALEVYANKIREIEKEDRASK
jgi:hypothetical protein